MSKQITIDLEAAAYSKLVKTATECGMTIEVMAAEAVINRVEEAGRYRSLLARIETIDQALLELAAFLGEATADSANGSIDLSQICKAVCPGSSK